LQAVFLAQGVLLTLVVSCLFPHCADFVRLLKDPAATHIELKGNLVFTPDHFPPENAHDQSKGVNVTHKASCLPLLAWVAWPCVARSTAADCSSRPQQQKACALHAFDAVRLNQPVAGAAMTGRLQLCDD
jgi:hypothetical protein